MNKEGRSISQGRPRFRSTKYNTLFRRNKIVCQPQESEIQKIKHNSTVDVQRFGKLVDFNSKRTSMPFTGEISINSQDLYLKTFNSFMSNNYDKQNHRSIQTYVIMNHYKSQFDQNQSNFTLLDVIKKPITFIEAEISSIAREMKSQNYKAEMIRHQLHSLDFAVRKQLEDIEHTTMNKLNELKKLLKNSEVFENQRKLRNKKQLKLLEKGHTMNKNKFQSQKERILDMQTLIFDCQPLQLQLHKYNEPQPTDEYL